MDTLVVQTGTRQGRVAELIRVHEGSLSVGRSFENDLVLTDLHVAPRQLELVQDGDQWRLVVLDHTNPVLHNGQKVIDQSPVVKSGDKVTIGRTRLALFSEQHPVEDTRKLVLSNWLSPEAVNPILPILVLLSVCAFDFGLAYFESSISLKWMELFSGALLAAVLMTAWAGFWAVSGRIVRHQYHLGLQLIATSGVFFAATVFGTLLETLAYPFHSPTVDDVFGWLLFFATLALLLRLNLIIATNIQRTTLVASISAAVVTAVFYGFFFLDDPVDVQYVPEYSAELKPPGLNFSGVSSLDDYFANVATVIEALPRD